MTAHLSVGSCPGSFRYSRCHILWWYTNYCRAFQTELSTGGLSSWGSLVAKCWVHCNSLHGQCDARPMITVPSQPQQCH